MNPTDLEEWIEDDLFAVTNALDNAGLFDSENRFNLDFSKWIADRANDFLFTMRCTALSLQQ